MPRAKLSEAEGFLGLAEAAKRLGVSSHIIRVRLQSGVLPPATKVTSGNVQLFDESWVATAARLLGEEGARRRGRRSRHQNRRPVVPTPASVLGYPVGTPQRLPDWPEMVAYFESLATVSDRVEVETLGQSTNGEPYIVVAISAPENLSDEARQRNRELLGRLFDPRGRPQMEIEEAIASAKTVALILATQHSNEIGAALMTLDLAHQLASGDDAETRELLSKTITLIIPSANPDGIRMIVDWYRRWLGTDYEGRGMPWLYHRYVGHDNNRDWFMLTQVENQHYAALHNREHPQLVFDMHQMGRAGARFMVPPFIDPLDPNQDPIIQQGFSVLGSAIAARLTAADKPGVATHIIFDNYSPSLSYGNYHGSIDLLSEAASCKIATPVIVEDDDLKGDDGFNPKVRTWNHPMPWKGGAWTLRDIIEYDLIAARAFLDHAAKYREPLLRDYLAINRRTVQRTEPPWAFVFPTEQTDPATATELLQTLERGAVRVDEAIDEISADGVTYPVGTRVVRLDQPAGNFAKTLLEIQHYPELRKWPGGPPLPPYDISGHTLPLQMGVRAIEVRRPLPDRTVATLRPIENLSVQPGGVHGHGTFGYAISPGSNNTMLAMQRLLAAGYRVHRASEHVPGLALPVGSVLVPRAAGLDEFVRTLAMENGLDVTGLDGPMTLATLEHERVRLGVYQSWNPCIDEGWVRWVLEQYEVPYTTLHDADIRQGGLATKFDAILLAHQGLNELRNGIPEKNEYKEPYPPEYVGGLGEVGLDALQTFVEGGGTVIAIDAAASAVAQRFALPVRNVLDGVANTDFYCPGSLLRVVMDSAHPLGYGLPRETTVLFLKSAAYELTGEGTVVARYPNSNPNQSGWILGPDRLFNKAALLDVPLGDGTVVLIGFRPHFRAQARGTYKVLFNAISRAGSRAAKLELGLQPV
jgi:hypothetical protein